MIQNITFFFLSQLKVFPAKKCIHVHSVHVWICQWAPGQLSVWGSPKLKLLSLIFKSLNYQSYNTPCQKYHLPASPYETSLCARLTKESPLTPTFLCTWRVRHYELRHFQTLRSKCRHRESKWPSSTTDHEGGIIIPLGKRFAPYNLIYGHYF